MLIPTNVASLHDYPSNLLRANAHLAAALRRGRVVDLADGILRHEASRHLDRKFLGRLTALADGALPSRTDKLNACRCARSLLYAEVRR